MNSPLGFSLGNPLNPMGTRFKLEPRVGAASRHAADDFLVAAVFPGTLAHDLNLPTALFSVQRIHSEEIAGKERGFITARTGAHLKKDIALVVGVFGDQQLAQSLGILF